MNNDQLQQNPAVTDCQIEINTPTHASTSELNLTTSTHSESSIYHTASFTDSNSESSSDSDILTFSKAGD